MSLSHQYSKKKIHNRNIEICTYSCDADHVLVVGEFKEQREVSFINQVGERVEPGVYHNMKIELLIATESMTIEDVAVSLPQVPRGDCSSVCNSLDSIKGMQIARGFSRVIKEMVGGTKGCVHLNTLLLAMAPAVLQGSWINVSWHQKETGKTNPGELVSLVDSCWTWRNDGPLVAEIKQRFGNGVLQQKASTGKEDS